MPCFCTAPASALTNMFKPGITMVLPRVPMALKLAATLPALLPANRLDMQMAAGLDPVIMPNIDFGGGALAQIAMTLNLMVGSFTLDDLPQLQFEMEQAAESFNHNIWPRLHWLPKLELQPLLNFAIIARLVINLEELGIDPFTVIETPPTRMIHDFRFRLTPTQVHMTRLLAGLPPLMAMNETLNLPPLGETGAVSALQNRLHGLAGLTPPKLIIPMPLLMKLVMVLESLATIQTAFGDAFSPQRMGQIQTMLRLWGSFPLPLPPLPALALNAKLQALPPIEDIRLGEKMAGSSSFAVPQINFSPPKLAIMPFMNVMLALHGSMEVALNMDPFDMCNMCPCA